MLSLHNCYITLFTRYTVLHKVCRQSAHVTVASSSTRLCSPCWAEGSEDFSFEFEGFKSSLQCSNIKINAPILPNLPFWTFTVIIFWYTLQMFIWYIWAGNGHCVLIHSVRQNRVCKQHIPIVLRKWKSYFIIETSCSKTLSGKQNNTWSMNS